MTAKVNSAFDIALYFTEKADLEHEYLQPQKLQGLLFLSQAYFCIAYKGQKLMPAIFVADDRGPIEPNIYVAFSNGQPNVDPPFALPNEVEVFLSSIWKRFGRMKTDQLATLTKGSIAYKNAKTRGLRGEILLEEMRISFGTGKENEEIKKTSEVKLYRTQPGEAVSIKKWFPGIKPS